MPDGTSQKLQYEFVEKSDPRVSSKLANEESIKKVALCIVPNEIEELSSFILKRSVTEFGSDHWQHYSYRAYMPIHCLNLTLECEDNLTVKDIIPYGYSGMFKTELSADNKSLEVMCSNWIEPGFGLSIIIAT
ncbi:MAG: hypothetical protein M0R39_12280 [Prolixibacteraceae bacterium]|nr:hypothetical protein [Prolixibacteraceae bacterium]